MTTRAERTGAEDERWFLNDEREFLLRSIDDAARERAAGDLSDADYEVLEGRDRTRLAEVEAELAALGPLAPTPPTAAPDPPVPADLAAADTAPRRRYGTWSRIGIAAACLLILAGAVILVNHTLNPAAPGQPLSGSTPTTKTQQIEEQLTAAGVLSEDGEGAQALQLYNKVLTEDPGDPDALAAGGWLEWNAGVTAKSAAIEQAGRQSEEKAIRASPSFYGGHLYLGLILLDQDDDAAGAVKQFTAFLADGPATSVVKSFAPHIAPAWAQLYEPLPAALAAVTSATTTTTTSAS